MFLESGGGVIVSVTSFKRGTSTRYLDKGEKLY
jgi:hypothetical protein